MFHKSLRGQLCKECISQVLLREYMLITVLFSWWGVISVRRFVLDQQQFAWPDDQSTLGMLSKTSIPKSKATTPDPEQDPRPTIVLEATPGRRSVCASGASRLGSRAPHLKEHGAYAQRSHLGKGDFDQRNRGSMRVAHCLSGILRCTRSAYAGSLSFSLPSPLIAAVGIWWLLVPCISRRYGRGEIINLVACGSSVVCRLELWRFRFCVAFS